MCESAQAHLCFLLVPRDVGWNDEHTSIAAAGRAVPGKRQGILEDPVSRVQPKPKEPQGACVELVRGRQGRSVLLPPLRDKRSRIKRPVPRRRHEL